MKRLEPLWWLLFGAGGFVAALVFPALFFVVAIAFPLGWLGDPIETFLRMRTLFANPVGQVLLLVILALPIWHAAHHTRHFVVELGFPQADRPLGTLLYVAAAFATVAIMGVIGTL